MQELTKWQHLALFYLPALLLLAMGCGADPSPASSEEAFADCRYGSPKPIFRPGLEGIAEHSFQLQGDKGIERITLADGLQLLIIQTGCDYIRQEFRFEWVDELPAAADEYWVQQAAEKFRRLGRLGPDYVVYLSLFRALEENAPQIPLRESIELQPGFYARIDRVASPERATLIVVLSEKP